jgi:hypothetical protein
MLYGDFANIVGMKTEDNDFRFEIQNNDQIACRARVVLTAQTSTVL